MRNNKKYNKLIEINENNFNTNQLMFVKLFKFYYISNDQCMKPKS